MSWPGSARSLCFRDPYERLVELITPGTQAWQAAVEEIEAALGR